MKYLVLLRGINVGGHRKVVMSELKAFFIAAGFDEVRTYINSGNLLFLSEYSQTETDEIIRIIFAENYSFLIEFSLISQEDYQKELVSVPNWWRIEDQGKYNALFLLPNRDYVGIKKSILENLTNTEQIYFGERAIFWAVSSVEKENPPFSSNLMKQKYYQDLTIRNRNTTLKLLELFI